MRHDGVETGAEENQVFYSHLAQVRKSAKGSNLKIRGEMERKGEYLVETLSGKKVS